MTNIVHESKIFHEQVISSILRPNREGLNILDSLGGCSHEQAQLLRTRTWGFELKGVSAPFIAEQFKLNTTASEEDIRNSILYVISKVLEPKDIASRGECPLYIGS